MVDAGSRGAVTAGKNMDGFLPLIEAILHENGLPDAIVTQNKAVKTLPGFFRPTKKWDYVVTYRGKLVAILEMKSQVGSFGNNFNNRCEEALGSATDFWTAFREGALGPGAPRPFLGYLMLVEDCPKSRTVVRVEPTAFRVFPEFENTSYINRYQILCRKLVSENLYTVATVLTSPTGSVDGTYAECCENTGMKRFVASFAAAVAAAAAESGGPVSATDGDPFGNQIGGR
jgi:hypothetical protein